jgi:D-2-hydroxyacid dehydrogenase (NADP+)
VTSLLIVLAMPEELIAHYREPLREHFPEIEVNAVDHRDKVDPYIAGADILLSFAGTVSDEVFRKARNLKWVQVLGTGTDRVADSAVLGPDVIVTNIHGAHGPPVAEAAISAMLALSRQMPRAIRAQDRASWERYPARLIDGKTATIFGMGVIAAVLAPRLKALGLKVIGVSSSPREVDGFDRVLPRERLVEAAAACDHFILLTPLTRATRGIVDERVFRAMRRDSYFINLGRGGTVDEEALVRALEDGRLAGAALDVFAVEPLPKEHPLWHMKNVLITAHMGGFFDEYPDRSLPVIEENLRRFLAGDTQHMVNLVNRVKATP